jgi:hypothetical protein
MYLGYRILDIGRLQYAITDFVREPTFIFSIDKASKF